jgi:hypothetical protein
VGFDLSVGTAAGEKYEVLQAHEVMMEQISSAVVVKRYL